MYPAEILTRFPWPSWALVRLLLWEDLPLPEAARRLDLTPSEALGVWRRAVAAVAR